MPINYSKWDNLELSDDSDIEVHPNVDKRSFIRAKQNQIHQERQHRRHQIETLKYERVVNDGLAARITALLDCLTSHADEARASPAKVREVAFRAVMESAAKLPPGADTPPTAPAGVHQNTQQPTTYSQMMAALLDQVHKAVDEKLAPDNNDNGSARYDATVAEIGEHRAKVDALQRELVAKLAELEGVEARKITSDGIHTGFDSSHVTKASSTDKSQSQSQPELLNPNYKAPDDALAKTSGDVRDITDADLEPTDLARQFGAIPSKDHFQSRNFISAHPEVLAERHGDGIMMLAFDAQMDGRADQARQYVHQAKLIEYCRSLGRDGVSMFFKRVATRDHKAHDLFYGDVNETYAKIRTRVAEILAERAAGGGSGSGDGGDVEQIQLHAVEPGTSITIHVPPTPEQLAAAVAQQAGTDDALDDADIAQAKRARAIFDGFAPEMRQALESGSLDAVNEVLGRMPVAAAEALVADFSEAGILSMEDKVIDTTTDAGRAQFESLARAEETSLKDSKDVSDVPDASKKIVYDDPE